MSNQLEKYHQEVTQKFLKSGKKFSKEKSDYLRTKMYQTSYEVYDVKNSVYEKLHKEGFSFSHLNLKEQAKIWTYIFKNTKYLGIGHLSICYFKRMTKRKDCSLLPYWPQLKTWVNKIENWVHSDTLASVYTVILEEDTSNHVYPILAKWSQTSSPWKRRMSLISLLYYHNPKRKVPPFKKIINLLEPQMNVDHYYLQKAVGWTLRELTTAYPKETDLFFQKKVNQISSTAFSASIEKLSLAKKNKLKEIRKKYRKKLSQK